VKQNILFLKYNQTTTTKIARINKKSSCR